MRASGDSREMARGEEQTYMVLMSQEHEVC